MKTLMLSVALGLGLWAAAPALASSSAAVPDVIHLKDGRTVTGQVVEEHAHSIVMVVGGVRRTYDRSLITDIHYGAGEAPQVPEGIYAPAPPYAQPPAGSGPGYVPGPPGPPPGSDAELMGEIAQKYNVPVQDVQWVRSQGVDDADLPLVFLIAATAQVTPRQVLELRSQGYNWDQIEQYFGMQSSDIYYEPGQVVAYPVYLPTVDWNWGWDGCWGCGWGGYYGGWYGPGWGWGGYYGDGDGDGDWGGYGGYGYGYNGWAQRNWAGTGGWNHNGWARGVPRAGGGWNHSGWGGGAAHTGGWGAGHRASAASGAAHGWSGGGSGGGGFGGGGGGGFHGGGGFSGGGGFGGGGGGGFGGGGGGGFGGHR